jgi:hypothetical protein
MNEFKNEIIEKIDNYVYRLIDPRNGETFYVGRGKENRVFNHVNGAIRTNNEQEDAEDSISLKLQRIINIKNAGLEVLHIIHRHGMDEITAKVVEAALIDAYPGLTNIMSGEGSNEYGPMSTKELIAKYTADEIKFEEGKKYLAISINNTISDNSIYDAVRYAWKIALKNAQQVDYILAESRGLVRGVFVNAKWYKATDPVFAGFPNHTDPDMETRFGFEGQSADPQVANKYLGKRTPPRKKGAAIPIRYFGFQKDNEKATNFTLCEFCNERKATTYKEILDTHISPYLPIKKLACDICASKPQDWMTLKNIS